MLSKAEYLATIATEMAITEHLVAKLQPAHLAFRFSPGQRSTQELMEYLSIQLAGIAGFFFEGKWDRWEALEKEAKGLTPAGFAATNAKQKALIEGWLAGISDAEFQSRIVKDYFGQDVVLAQGLTDTTVKYAVGYKMQLFLQAKAAGVPGLQSSNLWRGVDPEAKAQG